MTVGGSSAEIWFPRGYVVRLGYAVLRSGYTVMGSGVVLVWCTSTLMLCRSFSESELHAWTSLLLKDLCDD